jgi:hypothetical protein
VDRRVRGEARALRGARVAIAVGGGSLLFSVLINWMG